MSPGDFVALVAAAVGTSFVLAPLFQKGAAEAERSSTGLSERQDLHSLREMAMAALRDLEDDRATGKIGDGDYQDLKARLSGRAVDIMRRLDALPGSSEQSPPAARPARPQKGS